MAGHVQPRVMAKWRLRKPRTASSVASGSSMNGQWPLRSSTRMSRVRERLALALGERDRQVAVAARPRSRARAGRAGAARRRAARPCPARSAERAVEREHRAPRVPASKSSYMRSTNVPRQVGLPRRSRKPEARARGGGHEELAEARRAPQAGERVPAVAGQHAGAEQHGAGEALAAARRPSRRPHGPPKSCSTRWARSIAEPVERAAEERRVRGARSGGKPGRRVGAAEARQRPSATARWPRSPTAASSRSQSALEPGLPWTNTTASVSVGGPASRSGVRTPSTCSSVTTPAPDAWPDCRRSRARRAAGAAGAAGGRASPPRG